MLAPSLKIQETDKAEQLIVLTYEGLLKVLWLPKSLVSIKNKTINGRKGKIYYIPGRFARGHKIPNELFITDLDTFAEIMTEVLPDITPNLDEVPVKFSQTVRLPEKVAKLVEKGYVPLKRGPTIYLIPANHIISFDPRQKLWKILANTDFIESDGEVNSEYKSFVFILNGNVWEWKNGKIVPPSIDEAPFLTENEPQDTGQPAIDRDKTKPTRTVEPQDTGQLNFITLPEKRSNGGAL